MIERHLRKDREVEEATIAMLEEDRASTRRLEKAGRIRKAWKKRADLTVYLMMVKKLEKLSVTDWDMDMDEIK